MKILLTGARGQLGAALLAELQSRGHAVVAPTRAELELGRPDSIAAAVREARADWVVNCAAMTDVDGCERDPELARRINTDAAAALATAAQVQGSRLLQISTDYVFAGDAARPYKEQDPTGPLNVYGHTKLAAEQRLLAAAPDALIARTAWLYAAQGRNFLTTVLARMQAGEPLQVVDDQVGSPSATRDVARALAALLELGPRGVWHVAGAGCCSWYEFACAIAVQAVAAGLLARAPAIEPVGSDAYPRPARRPRYSALDTGRLEAALGAGLPPWRTSLRDTLQPSDSTLAAPG